MRIPSHCCGVFGLKPTSASSRTAATSTTSAAAPPTPTSTSSALSGCRDLDLLTARSPARPLEAVVWRLELPPARFDSAAGLRVGVWFDEPSAPVDHEYRALFLGAAADRLADCGEGVEAAHPPVDFDEQYGVFGHLVMEAMTPAMGDGDGGSGIGGSHLDWLRADMRRQEPRAVWRASFERHDLLLCPAMGTAAFPHNQKASIFERMVDVDGAPHSVLELISWLGFIGVLGVPSVCVPIGRTAGNLPVGIQDGVLPHEVVVDVAIPRQDEEAAGAVDVERMRHGVIGAHLVDEPDLDAVADGELPRDLRVLRAGVVWWFG